MFESRVTAAEFLDLPDCDPALAAASYRFMETVNCRFGGNRIVRRFLAAETAGRHADAPLRILDIGSGCCDIPLAVSRWARAHDIPRHFTCLEIAGHAVDIARGRLARAGNPEVHLLQEDAFTHQPAEPLEPLPICAKSLARGVPPAARRGRGWEFSARSSPRN